MFRSILAAALLLSGTAPQALEPEPLPVPAEGEQFWGLGSTGILCYRPPCPWRGVFRIDPDGTGTRPLSGNDLPEPPPLEAGAGDRARIEAAFADSGCVVAEGHFRGDTLVVARIAGECRDWLPRPPSE
ncbi:hypothetical protein H5395_13125 [Paracoccus sp. MC1854]|uniref:hypothetical protein n=1 Tax=Paracoccus sp. MC1854 TaxID=2760306 RepID=UPI0015FF8616|nr:hypothetical protein [Paracoccus sp. MC1854]MBB1492460.1 hypothetical protein [Paracoccus sp. MC1854]